MLWQLGGGYHAAKGEASRIGDLMEGPLGEKQKLGKQKAEIGKQKLKSWNAEKLKS